MDEIIEIISNFYNIDTKLLYSKSRKKEVVKCRFICFFFIRKNLNTSFQSIGNKFGKGHDTIIHGINKVEFEYNMYEDFRAEIRQIWILMKYSINFSKKNIKENVYREIILNLISTDMKLFQKLKLDEETRSWIYKDLKLNGQIINELEDVQRKKRMR